MSDFGQAPAPEHLQFQKAEPLPVVDPNAKRCVVCKTPAGPTYFHANGQTVCSMCAERIQSGQQKPPAISLATAVLYGAGAALAGCILYTAVVVLLNLEIGIVAIAVGFMVGKAVRAGSKGLGGRPQQILAVLLTYFSITTSYVSVGIYQFIKNPQKFEHAARKSASKDRTGVPDANSEPPTASKAAAGLVGALLFMFLLLLAAPFFGITSIGGLISLFIIFIGLKQAWTLTGRSDVLVTGPYGAAPAQ
jgi:hypothetical protein